MEFGAIRLSVAKLSEAAVMLSKGLTSILITSPIVSAVKLKRLERALSITDKLLLVVDHPDNIFQLQSIGKRLNKSISVLLDIYGGTARTGIEIKDAISFIGIQRYAGHLQLISDCTQRNQDSFSVMKQASDLVHKLSL